MRFKLIKAGIFTIFVIYMCIYNYILYTMTYIVYMHRCFTGLHCTLNIYIKISSRVCIRILDTLDQVQRERGL